ncbi:MAG: hypothetical protein GDA56_16610 [Hormoscilla sp. GM7CHS1pb]|nr:hypothetical protein [Hormoscilla sp. GM7CHS1pb]
MGGWIGKRSGAPAMSAHPCRARERHDRVGISGNGLLVVVTWSAMGLLLKVFSPARG